MPRFPKKEAEIQALAMNIVLGLWNNQPIYPDPSIGVMSLSNKVNSCMNEKNDAIAKQAAAEQETTAKDKALEELVEALKADIRYAGNTVNYDDDKLKLIGWTGKKAGEGEPSNTAIVVL